MAFIPLSSTTNTTTNEPPKFRAGLTRTQAEAEGLGNLFDKYNQDGDETISEQEFDVFQAEQPTEEAKAEEQTEAIARSQQIQRNFLEYKIPQQKERVAKRQQETTEVLDKGNPEQKEIGFYAAMQNVLHNAEKLIKEATRKDPNIKTIRAASAQLDNKQKAEVTEEALNTIIDTTKIDKNLEDKSISKLAQYYGVDTPEFQNSSYDEQCRIIMESIDNSFLINTDETNPDSLYSQELERIRTQGLSAWERQRYSNLDPDNLSDEEIEALAFSAVRDKYIGDAAKIISDRIISGNFDEARELMRGLMNSSYATNNAENILNILHYMLADCDESVLQEFEDMYASMYHSEDGADTELEDLSLGVAFQYANQESLEILYENNSHISDRLNNIAQNVANNSNDETRKSMLKTLVENSPKSTSTPQNNEVKNNATNPIMNTQAKMIADLKQASEAYLQQNMNRVSYNELPSNIKTSFESVRAFTEFKGSGLTIKEYEKVKSDLKSNFVGAIADIINYVSVLDTIKPKVFAQFDALDDNTLGDLYINGNNDVRKFMNKYGYMNSEKLLSYIERNPSERNNATQSVERMLQELEQEKQEKEKV